MEKLTNQISKIINDHFNIDAPLRLAPTAKHFGDFTTNIALQLAGRLKISPQTFFATISPEVAALDGIERIEQVGGHINLTVSPQYLAQTVLAPSPARPRKPHGKVAIVEFPSPNMAKPFSVGHLRSGNQGWAAKRILEETGWKVITDNHIGDYGTPFGIWVAGFMRFSSPEQLEQSGIEELGRIYVKMRQELKAESERGESVLADEVQEWFQKLSAGDPQAKHYHDLFYRISLDHIHGVMDRLGINTDYEYGESSYIELANQLIEQYISSGIVTENPDGSAIIDLTADGIDTPMLVRKSNGLPLYATTDIATLVFREQQFHPDLVVYSVGNEQQFHFTQLFKVAKKIGINYDTYHLSYGLIEDIDAETGKRKKISSRKGTVLLEELLDTAEQHVKAMIADKNISAADIKKIAIGAIKFRDFSQDRMINYLFDWESMFNLTGFSCPYIQYAIVRMNKIIQSDSYTPSGAFHADYSYETEKPLLLKLTSFDTLLDEIAHNFSFHILAGYLFDLAKLVNAYYETTPILKSGVSAAERAARLDFIFAVSQTMAKGLDILGISVPDNM